jgi:murein DD-endopeptidase MepM/ murein hydrolase activator NlpD
VTAFKSAGGWIALVGIDVEQPAGPVTMKVDARVGSSTVSAERRVTVSAKQFVTRRLTVAPSFVNPSADDQLRIADDNRLLQTVYARSAEFPLWESAFVRPVPQPANSQFGARSIFNGEARSPHAGTDFPSPEGTAIAAPNAGLVVLARDLFFSGNTIVVDHGLGVFSTLAHLSRIDVVEGQPIVAGELIGRVGATGRVTGPHLHWAVRVGGARIDALSVLAVLGEPDALSGRRGIEPR